jgi:hypothetical protein
MRGTVAGKRIHESCKTTSRKTAERIKGFATGLLHAGVDPKTVADRGGWRDTKIVMSTYAHAMQDKRVTEVLTAGPAKRLRTGG